MSETRSDEDSPPPPEPGGRPHHPLPASEEARRGEVPETLEREKGFGDDGAEATGPLPSGESAKGC